MKKIGLGLASLSVASMLLSGCSSNGLPTDQIPQGLGGDTNASPSASASDTPSSTPTPTPDAVVDTDSKVPQPKEEVEIKGDLPLSTDGFDYSNPDKTVVRNLPSGPIDQNGNMTGNPADYQGLNGSPGNTPANVPAAPEIVDKVGQGSESDKRNAAESYIKYLNFKNEGSFSEACKYARLAAGSTGTCEEKLAAADPRFNNHPAGIRIDRVSNVNIVDGDKAELVPAVFIYGDNQRLAKVEVFRTENPAVWQIVV